jgi:glycosyl transferase family 2
MVGAHGHNRRVTRPDAPPEVQAAAEARSEARAARDWATADRLRGEIEAAGWTVVDSGTAFRLEPANPPDVVADGEIRYGSSASVPSRLAEPEFGLASVIVVAREDPAAARRALDGLAAHAPAGIDAIVVADGLSNAAIAPLRDAGGPPGGLDVVRTSDTLGQGAAWNVGLRRSTGGAIVILDPSVEPAGDVVTPLVRALDDPAVAVAGATGLTSSDLRHFLESPAGPVAAIGGHVLAFRRADAVARGPIDEAFRFPRHLDAWWSLVLRDAGVGERPREARIVPGLPLVRHADVAWETTPVAARDRLAKRNLYRVLDRFRDRPELAVPSE